MGGGGEGERGAQGRFPAGRRLSASGSRSLGQAPDLCPGRQPPAARGRVSVDSGRVNKAENSVPQPHCPHFKCSAATSGQWLASWAAPEETVPTTAETLWAELGRPLSTVVAVRFGRAF